MNRYEEYQETGFEWLGKIPSNWGLSRVGKFFTERSEKVDDVTYPPLSVTMSGIVDQLSDVAKTNDGGNRKLVKKHDFVINSRSDRKGSSGISPRDGSVSLINIVLEPRELDPQFIQYLFKNYYFKEEYFRNGKGIHWDLWTTRWDQLKNIKFPIPSNNEQQLISRYLDKKTEQIDSLVKKIQKKIELLKEQRTSLINQCITNGLDPNVEMKDSGVEWIGEIPSHWHITKIKHICDRVGDGLHSTPNYVDESSYRFINGNNLVDGLIKFSESTRFVSEEEYKKHFIPLGSSSLLVSINGTIGNVSRYNGETVILGKSSCYINFQTDLNINFLYWVIKSKYVQEFFRSELSGTTIFNLSLNSIRKTPVLFPSPDEQRQIVNHLEHENRRITNLVNLELQRIKLLSEYRQSLISSVVTGKVRVTEDMI